jgi:hypothetical protein
MGFMALCIYGLIDWKKSMNKQEIEEELVTA